MNFQLVKGNVNVILPAQAVDGAVELIHRVAAIAQFTNIQTQFMIQRTGPEGGEENRWRRLLHHFRMIVRGLQQHLFHFIQIGAIGDAEADHHPGHGVGERPVDQALGNERLVRDNHLFAIEVGDGGRADTDFAYRTGEGADGYRIPNAHWTLEQNNQTGDEVTEDLLQAKT